MSARTQTESTKETYKKNLIRLNDGKEIKNYNFLKKTDDILKKIEHLKPNSQRSYLISIVSTIKGLKGFDMVNKFYYNLMMQMNKDLKVNNSKSETQTKNWISQDEVMQIWQNLYDKTLPLLQLKKVNEKEWTDILHFIVLSLYTLNSPRRNLDYQKMLYLNTPKDLGDNFRDFNYMDKDKFLFYNYKTKNSYNLQDIPISPELLELLKLYVKLHPLKKSKNPYLLVHYNGQPLDKVNDITRILNKIFGKKIGVSMLRNIYLTDKFKAPMDELKATANAMGTSSATIENNYIKTDESQSMKDLINV
jgi:integrase